MADPGTVLALVLAGHLVGDWLVQSDRQAAGKTWPQPVTETAVISFPDPVKVSVGQHLVIEPGTRRKETMQVVEDSYTTHAVVGRIPNYWRSWRLNQAHMLGYHLTMLAVVAFSGLNATPAAVLLSISWATHSFIDRRWPVRWLMRHTGSAAFAETSWGVMAVDQALHLSILMVLVAALAP